MSLTVHWITNPEDKDLQTLRADLDPSISLTVGEQIVPASDTHILVTRFPKGDHLVACPHLQALVIPFAGFPEPTRRLIIVRLVGPSWDSGTVTVGPTVRALEEEVCRQTGARYCVALSSCTAGLMLIPGALGLPAGKEVIVPSFTFAATAQALLWNGLIPVFADCLPGTCTIDPEDVERSLSPDTAAICGVSIFGLPPDYEALLELGRRKGLPVYFDSAQGLGATYHGQPLGGFGVCEIFSMSPTLWQGKA